MGAKQTGGGRPGDRHGDVNCSINGPRRRPRAQPATATGPRSALDTQQGQEQGAPRVSVSLEVLARTESVT